MQYIRNFAARHDHLPAFRATYLVLTALIATMLPLGAFGILIVAHMALDLVKVREIGRLPWGRTIAEIVREGLVDITLLSLGLLFAVYLHHSLPLIAGLSGLYRAEMTIIHAVGTFVPKVKILTHFLDLLTHMQAYLADIPRRPRRCEPLEYVSLFGLCVMAVLLALAPSILGLTTSHFVGILLSELVPWNV